MFRFGVLKRVGSPPQKIVDFLRLEMVSSGAFLMQNMCVCDSGI